MFRLGRKYLNVGWIVVQLISVDMVNNFSRAKRPSKNLLSNLAVQMASEILSIGFSFSGT